MAARTCYNQIPTLRIGRWKLLLHTSLPELLLQIDHFLFIVCIPFDFPDNDLVLRISIQTTEKYLIHVHDCHIMASLGFIIDRYCFLSVQPPVITGIIICSLNLQNSRFPIWQGDKVIHIRQHEGILWVSEHLLNLVDFIPRLSVEYLRHHILQKMPHFHGYPVSFLFFHICNLQFVIINISGRPEWRNPQYGSHITSTDSPASKRQPFLSG